MNKEKSKHDQLSDIGIEWLYKNGCGVFSTECQLLDCQIADAIGVKTHTVKVKKYETII